MPYESILKELVRAVPGSLGAVLLDSEGEVVVEAGARDERHRLIGAYQGIALGAARRTAKRYGWGTIEYMMCRYEEATLILRPLRDGYYLIVSVGPASRLAEGVHWSKAAQDRMDKEI